MDFRFVLALRAIIAALVAVPVLGVLFGGLPPPVTFLYWTTFIVTAMMVARLATTLSVKTPNMSHVMAVATAPANKRLAANCRADDDVGHGKEAALPLAMRVRPTVVLSA